MQLPVVALPQDEHAPACAGQQHRRLSGEPFSHPREMATDRHGAFGEEFAVQ